MTELTTTNFINFYPQEFLNNGQLGLTSEDIAKSTGTKKFHVHEKFNKMDKTGWKEMGWNFIEVSIKTKDRGRPRKLIIFNEPCSKVFIARGSDSFGNGYLNYLFQCERFVEEGIPKLKAEIKKWNKKYNTVVAENTALKKPKQRRIGKEIIETYKRVETTPGEPDIFTGEIEIFTKIIPEKEVISKATPEGIRQHRIRRLSAIGKGVSGRLEEDVNGPIREAKKNNMILLNGNDQKHLGT